jgi:hypothetical protein
MILGFILADLIEANFHRALGVGFGSYTVFFKRPISLAMVIVTCLFVAWPWIRDFYRRRRLDPGTTESADVHAGEFYFGGLVTLLLLTFLFSSFRYSSEVRLFPVIVSTIGLVLIVYWFFVVGRTATIKPRALKNIRSSGGMPALVSLGLVAAYALLVPAAGFIAASMVFFLLVMFLSNYIAGRKRWKLVSLLTIGIGLFLLTFSRLLHVNLPTGLLR